MKKQIGDKMENIILNNRSKIEINNDQLTNLITEANLPTGKLVLLFNDEPPPLLPGDNQGACISRDLLSFDPPYARICEGINAQNWDVCIAISGKYCNLYDQFPAYFMYLIGHELGHAKICLTNLCLHIHCILIEKRIRQASHDKITKNCELPHERYCDLFGIYLCEKIFPRKKLNEEINTLISENICKDIERLKIMLSMHGADDFHNLREELIQFSLPYKLALISCWEKDKETCGKKTLANCIVDYEALFR